MWNVLFLSLALTAPLPGASLQTPAPPGAEAPARITPPARPPDPAFDELVRAYLVQLREYDQARLQVGRKKLAPEKAPPHPAIAWWPRFAALADQGSGSALGWMMFSLASAKSDEIDRRQLASELLERVLAKHAEEAAALDAVSGLKLLFESLGAEESAKLFAEIAERSTHPDVQSTALLARAWAIRKGGPSDPARQAEVGEIYRSIVFGFPGTAAAREATNALHPGIEAEFLSAERAWLEEVEALQAAGKSAEDWPPQPMHEFQSRFVPFAAAGDKLAKRWTEQFYPAYAQAERTGRGFGLSWLADALPKHYGRDPEGWGGVRMKLLRALYREWPDAKWVRSSLESLRADTAIAPPEMFEATFEPLLARNADVEIHAMTTFLVAESLRARADQEALERSLELYQKVVDAFPAGTSEGLAYEAATRKARLAERMPGAPAPAFRATDAEGVTFELADYRGHVVVLEFWSFNQGLDRAGSELRRELVRRFAGKPFHWVGANVDPTNQSAYSNRAGELGISWRNALLLSSSDDNVGAWDARPVPTIFVIDAAGVIRGRNLPWDAMVALIEKLVAETPAVPKPAADQPAAKATKPN